MPRYGAVDEIPEGHGDATRIEEIISEMAGLSAPVIPWNRDKWTEQCRRWSVLMKELKGLVPVVSVGVCDGKASYVVAEHRDGWMIFQWFDGGGDNYVSPFGQIIAVPADVGLKMVAGGRYLTELFASKEV